MRWIVVRLRELQNFCRYEELDTSTTVLLVNREDRRTARRSSGKQYGARTDQATHLSLTRKRRGLGECVGN